MSRRAPQCDQPWQRQGEDPSRPLWPVFPHGGSWRCTFQGPVTRLPGDCWSVLVAWSQSPMVSSGVSRCFIQETAWEMSFLVSCFSLMLHLPAFPTSWCPVPRLVRGWEHFGAAERFVFWAPEGKRAEQKRARSPKVINLLPQGLSLIVRVVAGAIKQGGKRPKVQLYIVGPTGLVVCPGKHIMEQHFTTAASSGVRALSDHAVSGDKEPFGAEGKSQRFKGSSRGIENSQFQPRNNSPHFVRHLSCSANNVWQEPTRPTI